MFNKTRTADERGRAARAFRGDAGAGRSISSTARRSRAAFPAGLEQAVFGLGCFWGAERKFWQLPGVYTTAVGYAAGHTPNPTYREVCSGMTGHNEVVLVVFDPKKMSYDELLKTFWESHDPTQGMRQGNDVGTQYRSGIYYFDDAQREAAERSRDAYQAQLQRRRLRRASRPRSCRRREFYLRRGLPPAVPRQESRRLLRPRRDRRDLPGRRGSALVVPSTVRRCNAVRLAWQRTACRTWHSGTQLALRVPRTCRIPPSRCSGGTGWCSASSWSRSRWRRRAASTSSSSASRRSPSAACTCSASPGRPGSSSCCFRSSRSPRCSLFRSPLLRWLKLDKPGRDVDSLVGEIAVPLEDIAPGAVGRAELRGTSGRRATATAIAARRAGSAASVVARRRLMIFLEAEGARA